MKKHLIIDGNNLVHRAFWISSNSDSANHVFITLRSVKSYVDQFKPDKIWCAWDMRTSSEGSLRKKLDSEYKQTRDVERNREVHEQTNLIVEFFEKLGVKNVFPGRGEADDIIFWLSKNLDGEKIIVSADTDFFQLIGEHVKIYSPIKKELYDISSFSAKFGFLPGKYAQYKAITGDKADNICGVEKFGNKKALKVLNEEIKLTNEQKDRVEANLKLIDLDNTGDAEWDKEYALYEDQLSQSEERPNFDLFIKMCEDNNFKSISHNQSSWHESFFMKNVMLNIVAELFSK